MEKLYIIKIGGNIIDNEVELASFLTKFSKISAHKILIHGGGKLATQMGQRLGIEAQMVDGRRITDAETLKIVTMVYAGYINKNVVAKLQALHCNAIGLTGADGMIIPANKRTNSQIDYGFVGDPIVEQINSALISRLIKDEMTPILAPITADRLGNLLNTNADTIASALSVAMAQLFEVKLCYCFEKIGVLANPDDDNSFIPRINFEQFKLLKEKGIVSKGMIPKLDNAFDALQKGVRSVYICHANNVLELIENNSDRATELVWE